MIPSFGETIRFWFRLGWFSFGGPAGQINLMYQTLVEEKNGSMKINSAMH
ncbi:hypothetical protein LEP1GSC127_0622 [Leptospira kirschneri str. 200801925]|nr:hypothetical protein LEP1GSC127_0622 [Leptospira kirschneri str. 200801925]